MMKRLILFLLLGVLHFTTHGQTDSAPVISVEDFISGLDAPADLKHAGDERLFVLEQHEGDILIFDAQGNRFDTPFLSIGDQISTGNEQGLLCLAFHPQYDENGYFFVYYTNSGGDGVLSRFRVSEEDENIADPQSEEVVITIGQPYSNHNGATIAFGPDGMLYFSLGDGGSGGDPDDNAQNPQLMLGKILRLDVNAEQDNPQNLYSIPDDNPFVNDDGVLDEIWALGLRNPWRISFDPLTNDLWIADVGQSDREEINFQPASSTGGENYGWRCYEGNIPHNTEGCEDESAYVFPVHDYVYTGFSGHCSVTGGYVYRGTAFPELDGHYVFGDWCSETIWSLFPDGKGGFTKRYHTEGLGGNLNSFGKDVNGELYACLNNGAIKKIVSEEEEQSPYTSIPHEVPGLIEAEEFDLGGQGLAYNDESNTNAGGAFRQDEFVDIENTSDNSGTYNIYEMETGEWLEYTVDVEATGSYDMAFRVYGQGSFTLEANGELIGDTVDVQETQGQWQTIRLEDVSLEAGVQSFRFHVQSEGIKLNYMEVTGTVTDINSSVSNQIQIYPTPFKDEVFINTPKESKVTVTDHAGNKVYTAETDESGVSIGQDFAPGVYFVNVIDGHKVHTRKVIKMK